MKDFLWWRDGVIYQVYPRSFVDTNGDGFGDLPGIIDRLDYLSDLGVDAIWLSPVYPSPDKDFGYDISDYLAIDPRYGTMADFDRLVSEAHQRGIRVVMDMVLNHTSDEHPWFKESRSSRDNPWRDWYIWRDPRRNGKFPNNWHSTLGGRAWDFDEKTGQYYLHLFTPEQPDLNWRNPQVRKKQLDAFRFWLGHDVDGFRMDVFNAYFKHPDLPDNPPKLGLRAFDRQRHIYDIDQPEMVPFLQELRRLLDSYPERYAVGETFFATPAKTLTYCGPDKLHAAFSFDFTIHDLFYPWFPLWIMRRIKLREAALKPAGIWPTNVLSNHDIPRAACRYCRGEDDSQAKISMALLLTLRGTPFMYYGEEIGMRNIDLHRNEIHDPVGKRYWPIYRGRDAARSPMQWNTGINAGFSTGKPWLHIHPDYLERNVAVQQADPSSLLNFTRNLIALRKQYPALYRGDLFPIKGHNGLLAYMRFTESQSILVVMNYSSRRKALKLPSGLWEELLSDTPETFRASVQLGPHQIRLLIQRQ